jgi:hypothetical protein
MARNKSWTKSLRESQRTTPSKTRGGVNSGVTGTLTLDLPPSPFRAGLSSTPGSPSRPAFAVFRAVPHHGINPPLVPSATTNLPSPRIMSGTQRHLNVLLLN